jgi:hypothetical protein
MVSLVSINFRKKTGKLSERQPNFFINKLNKTKPSIVTFFGLSAPDIFGQKLSERLKNQ